MAISPWSRQWSKIMLALDQNRVRLQRKPAAILAERDPSEMRLSGRLIAISLCFNEDNCRRDDRAEELAEAATAADMVNRRGGNIFNGL